MAKQSSPQKSLLDVVSPGKKARLYDMLYNHGPGNGTLMFLPIDQGIEHGPRDFFPNPASKDPDYEFALAVNSNYSGIACQIGFATKYWPDWAGKVPLLLKVNAKTDIPPGDEAFSAVNASVLDGVRLGATAIGYTLYVGSPRQDEDLKQLGEVRADCEKYGLPLVIWAYPRGRDVVKKGGQDSFYAIDYAARMAMEMGADIVKINMPKVGLASDADSPAPYNKLQVTQQEAIRQCVESAGRSLVVLSGGNKASDAEVLDMTKAVMKAGGSGVIYGRNIWQRKPGPAKKIVSAIGDVLVKNVIRTP